MIVCNGYQDYGFIKDEEGTTLPVFLLDLWCDDESELESAGDGFVVDKSKIANAPVPNKEKMVIRIGSTLTILSSKKCCFSNSEEQFIPFN